MGGSQTAELLLCAHGRVVLPGNANEPFRESVQAMPDLRRQGWLWFVREHYWVACPLKRPKKRGWRCRVRLSFQKCRFISRNRNVRRPHIRRSASLWKVHLSWSSPLSECFLKFIRCTGCFTKVRPAMSSKNYEF